MGFRSREYVDQLIKRDGLKCQLYFCKMPFKFDISDITSDLYPTIDHVVPKAAGGTDDLDNLVIAHRVCNARKAARLYLPDGTLEPTITKTQKEKVVKKQPCKKCMEGRNLTAGQICPLCGLGPRPLKYPRYKQKSVSECDHTSQDNFCWACLLGFVDRKGTISV